MKLSALKFILTCVFLSGANALEASAQAGNAQVAKAQAASAQGTSAKEANAVGGNAIGVKSQGQNTQTGKIYKKRIKKKVYSEPKKNWDVSLGYDFRFDLAEPTEDKTYEHSLNFDYSYKMNSLRGSIGLSLGYYSVENEIPRENDNPYLDDAYVGGDWTVPFHSDHKIISSFYAYLPTGGGARFEQYYGIYKPAVAVSSKWSNVISTRNQLQMGYVANEYYYSPVSQEPNPKWLVDYMLRVNFDFLNNWTFRLQGSYKLTQDVEGHQFGNANQLAGIVLNMGAWSGSITYINGSYNDEGAVRLWAFDKYRRVVMSGISYDF